MVPYCAFSRIEDRRAAVPEACPHCSTDLRVPGALRVRKLIDSLWAGSVKDGDLRFDGSRVLESTEVTLRGQMVDYEGDEDMIVFVICNGCGVPLVDGGFERPYLAGEGEGARAKDGVILVDLEDDALSLEIVRALRGRNVETLIASLPALEAAPVEMPMIEFVLPPPVPMPLLEPLDVRRRSKRGQRGRR